MASDKSVAITFVSCYCLGEATRSTPKLHGKSEVLFSPKPLIDCLKDRISDNALAVSVI